MGASLLRLRPKDHRGSVRLDYASHFGVGLAWGLALSAAARAGLRGQTRVAAVYGLVWNSDWVGLVALGIDKPPWKWSRRDLVVDVGEKIPSPRLRMRLSAVWSAPELDATAFSCRPVPRAPLPGRRVQR